MEPENITHFTAWALARMRRPENCDRSKMRTGRVTPIACSPSLAFSCCVECYEWDIEDGKCPV